MLKDQQIMGARTAPEGVALADPDPTLADALEVRFGPYSNPEAGQVPVGLCFPASKVDPNNRAAGLIDAPRPDCWVVRFTDSTGPRRRSEERRGGKECVRPCRSRGSPYH